MHKTPNLAQLSTHRRAQACVGRAPHAHSPAAARPCACCLCQRPPATCAPPAPRAGVRASVCLSLAACAPRALSSAPANSAPCCALSRAPARPVPYSAPAPCASSPSVPARPVPSARACLPAAPAPLRAQPPTQMGSCPF